MSRTWALLDHWVVDLGELTDFHDKLHAFMRFTAHLKSCKHQLRALPFLNESYWLEVYSRAQDSERGTYMALISDLGIEDGTSNPEVQGLSLEDSWRLCARHVLRSDDTAGWRDPVVFAPASRLQYLSSDGQEIEIAEGAKRVLVNLDDLDSNPLYLTDFDPWKCERSRGGDQDKCARDLPRPPACDGATMDAWSGVLGDTSDALTDNTTHLYFIPSQGWEPESVTKDDWRRHPFGARCSKDIAGKGTKSGPKDRRGRIWDWDDAHGTHWDVQHESSHDIRYMNVRPDGVITKR